MTWEVIEFHNYDEIIDSVPAMDLNRNLSQLSLAVWANISQRHVSWLENGGSFDE